MPLAWIRKVVGSGLSLVEPLLWGILLEIRNFKFDLYDSLYKKIGEPSANLCGQVKLINFAPQSILPNTVECFLVIKEGRCYMFAHIETFHNRLREMENLR